MFSPKYFCSCVDPNKVGYNPLRCVNWIESKKIFIYIYIQGYDIDLTLYIQNYSNYKCFTSVCPVAEGHCEVPRGCLYFYSLFFIALDALPCPAPALPCPCPALFQIYLLWVGGIQWRISITSCVRVLLMGENALTP